MVLQLNTIKERLEKLAQEREQLLEYQRLDKKRKAIEFCILDHDRVKVVKELNEVRSTAASAERQCGLKHDACVHMHGLKGCCAVQNGQKQEDVQAMAAQARDGINGTNDQFQAKLTEVQEIEREIGTVEKAVQVAQEEVDQLTQRQAQLDIDIKEFQASEHNAETDKVCATATCIWIV